MNVLIIGKFYVEAFSEHIAETFERMGHTVVRHEVGIKVSQSKSVLGHRKKMAKQTLYDLYSKTGYYRKASINRLIAVVQNDKVDFCLCCHDLLSPVEIAALKKATKAPIALWFPDAIANFRKAMFLDSEYDALFFKEPYVVKVLANELKKNAYYLPECCNPRLHNRQELSSSDIEKYSCEITTAGNMHTARSAMFKLLTNYDVRIWGNPPPRWMDTSGIDKMIQNHFVSNEQKSKAFKGAKIVLNSVHPTEVFGVNVRTFEIAASDAFQIVSWRPSISDLYIADEEIVCFKTFDELNDKIKFYLKNQEEREKIAEKAYIRTMKEHTYELRLELLLSTIFGNSKGFNMIDI